jgi:Na+-driven multidrug efflux pump
MNNLSSLQQAIGGQVSSMKILRIWGPSVFSYFCITAEMPIVTIFISRLGGDDAIVAFGLALTLLILFNMPAFALGATVAALAKGQKALKKLLVTTLLVGSACSIGLLLLVATPALNFISIKMLDLSPSIAYMISEGIWAFFLAPYLLACRRYCQGIMIVAHETKPIALATWARLCISLALAFWTISYLLWPPVFAGALSLTIGSACELAILSYFVRSKVKKIASKEASVPSTIKILRYYSPIVVASILALAYQPIINTALSHMNEPEVSLTAWTVLFQFLGMFNSFTLEIDSITVTISRIKQKLSALKYCWLGLGCCLSAIVLVFALTPLGEFYFIALTHLSKMVADVTLTVLGYCLGIPALLVIRMWLRGRLIAQGFPSRVQYATGAGVCALVLFFAAVPYLSNIPGLYFAVAGFYLSLIVECSTALFFVKREDGKKVLEGIELTA